MKCSDCSEIGAGQHRGFAEQITISSQAVLWPIEQAAVYEKQGVSSTEHHVSHHYSGRQREGDQRHRMGLKPNRSFVFFSQQQRGSIQGQARPSQDISVPAA